MTISPFEDAILQEESYDLIYAASAFHWVDAKTSCPKAFRLLKRGGTFALMRYSVVPSDGDESSTRKFGRPTKNTATLLQAVKKAGGKIWR